MKTSKVKKIGAAVLSAALCLSLVTAPVLAAGSAGSTDSAASGQMGTPPSGGPGGNGGTPPSGNPGGNGGTPPSGNPGGNGGTPPSGNPGGNGGTAPSGNPGGNGGTAASGAPDAGGAPAGGGGANTMTYDYSGTLSGALTADGAEKSSDGETVTASTADQNAALAENGGTLKITNGKLVKSGDDTNGDNCNFYGLNSILLAVGDASKAYISGSTLSASSEGSNGIFATNGSTIYANEDTIATTAGNSRGLDATYGGNILANKLNITTQGDHCASIATDRGGGNISVTNSQLATAGSGSPLLYSTGNIQVSKVTGKATGSQLAGMEGLNTILIYDSSLESTITKATASDPMADGIIIYQSTSGDAESTTGEKADFEAVNSTLKSAIESGAMFYFTNTSAKVVLSGTTLDFDSSKARLIEVQGNDANNWGTAGSNGAKVVFTGLGETLKGDIDVDTISSLNLYLLENSSYTGAITVSTNAANTSPTDAPAVVNIDSGSKWVVTGNSTVSQLNAAAGAQIVDESGKTVTIVAGGQTAVQGDSQYTVTVTGSYSTTVTTGDDNALTTSFIDRSTFDSTYGTSTAFTATTVAASESPAASASADTQKTSTKKGVVYVGLTAAAAALLGIWAAKKHNREEAEEAAKKKDEPTPDDDDDDPQNGA